MKISKHWMSNKIKQYNVEILLLILGIFLLAVGFYPGISRGAIFFSLFCFFLAGFGLIQQKTLKQSKILKNLEPLSKSIEKTFVTTGLILGGVFTFVFYAIIIILSVIGILSLLRSFVHFLIN